MTRLSATDSFTFRQRWNHFLLMIFAVVGILLAINLRDSIFTATTVFFNSEVGVQAEYPINWLIDSSADYVFRARDMARRGFKPTIQVEVQPAGTSTTARTILDTLTLGRSQSLAAYRVLTIRDSFSLPDETLGAAMDYTYATSDADPFLQSMPTVVRGLDVVTIRRGQVFIITFLSNASDFDRDTAVFQNFLNRLRL